jgi:hypothetical protein
MKDREGVSASNNIIMIAMSISFDEALEKVYLPEMTCSLPEIEVVEFIYIQS